MDNRGIGVFDSGIGGLTVLKELIKELPNENYIYFGDTKRLPYGSKDEKTIKKYSKEIADFLAEKNVKIIVIACNTITVNAMEYLSNEVDIKFFGTTTPGVKAALKETKNKNIALLATQATVDSGVYENKLKEADDRIKVYSLPCPDFVPMIENNMENTLEMREAVENTLCNCSGKNVDTVILGCTHYPYILNTLEEVCGEKVKFVNPAVELAVEIKRYLKDNNMENLSQEIQTPLYYTSGDVEKFRKDGAKHMGGKNIQVLKKEF